MENKQCTKKCYLNLYRHLNTKLYDSGPNYNEVSRKGDPWDDVSHCNCGRWQKRMEAVNLASHFIKKSFISGSGSMSMSSYTMGHCFVL